MESALWERVGELADRAPRVSDLRHHRLQLLAGSRMRSRGEEVPGDLRAEERRQAAAFLTAPVLLRRIRSASEGRLVLMKGREAGARWAHPRLRPSRDVDLLADDAPAVHVALLAAGFVAAEDLALFGEFHHLAPLVLPGVPLAVEIHSRPNWPPGSGPSIDEIAEAAGPCALGIDGILAPAAAHHAVLLAAHAWSHEPLGRVGSLADVAALTEEAGCEAVAAVARAWGVSRVWSMTARTVEELLYADPRTVRQPIWKRHLGSARERTVFEGHVARFSGPIAAASPAHAPAAVLGVLADTLRPSGEETWSSKLRRSLRAARNASARRSAHEAGLAEYR
jgi:hypothetical protein